MRPTTDATPNRRFQFNKRSQLFIHVHNETLSVAAIRVNNPDRSPVAIGRRNVAQTPTALLEIVGDDFPILHKVRDFASLCCVSIGKRLRGRH